MVAIMCELAIVSSKGGVPPAHVGVLQAGATSGLACYSALQVLFLGPALTAHRSQQCG
jgi:hypothetical protein